MSKVLCLGDVCADIIIPYGEALHNKEVEVSFSSGGTIANSADGLAKLNVPCSFVGVAGNDLYGKSMKKELESVGVDCHNLILKDDISTVCIMAVIGENKDRFNFLFPKKNPSHLQLFDEDLENINLEEYDYLLTTGLMLFEEPACKTVVEFLKKCHDKGIKICLDINMRVEVQNMDTTYLKQAIEYTNYLFTSAYDELVPLTGINDIDKAANSLVTKDRIVIARMADKGSIVYDINGKYETKALKVEVVDTLGAGDAYNAGFICALVNGKNVEIANKYGSIAGSLNVTKKGAKNCPTEKMIEKYLKNL